MLLRCHVGRRPSFTERLPNDLQSDCGQQTAITKSKLDLSTVYMRIRCPNLVTERNPARMAVRANKGQYFANEVSRNVFSITLMNLELKLCTCHSAPVRINPAISASRKCFGESRRHRHVAGDRRGDC